MTIEKGRFYKTREGEKVTIYKTDCISVYPIHGSISVCGKDVLAAWTPLGKYSTSYENGAWDIVSEWVEPEAPRPRMLAYMVPSISGINMGYVGFSRQGALVDIPLGSERAPWLDEPDNTDKGEVHAN